MPSDGKAEPFFLENMSHLWYIVVMKESLIIAFGSQISGRTRPDSDFDFGVLSPKPLSLSERTDIAEFLSNKFHINEDKIDLVDLSSASPILKFEVAKNGELVKGDNFDFIRFKVHAFKEYQDTAKFRRIREKVMMNPVRNRGREINTIEKT